MEAGALNLNERFRQGRELDEPPKRIGNEICYINKEQTSYTYLPIKDRAPRNTQ